MPCAANTGFPPMRFYSNGLRCIIKAIESSRHAERGRKQIWPRKKKLSQEQKLQAVLYCLEHQLDYRRTSEQYKITYQQIYSWVKKYQGKGEAGLLDRRGKRRPPSEYSEEEKAAAKLRQLEAENRRLQMENDFLKKLNELEGRR